jgi:hypothetical protein
MFCACPEVHPHLFSTIVVVQNSGTPPKKTDYWFSKHNRVLLHYSVSIAAAAATATYIPVSSGGVYRSVNGGGGAYSSVSGF